MKNLIILLISYFSLDYTYIFSITYKLITQKLTFSKIWNFLLYRLYSFELNLKKHWHFLSIFVKTNFFRQLSTFINLCELPHSWWKIIFSFHIRVFTNSPFLSNLLFGAFQRISIQIFVCGERLIFEKGKEFLYE